MYRAGGAEFEFIQSSVLGSCLVLIPPHRLFLSKGPRAIAEVKKCVWKGTEGKVNIRYFKVASMLAGKKTW